MDKKQFTQQILAAERAIEKVIKFSQSPEVIAYLRELAPPTKDMPVGLLEFSLSKQRDKLDIVAADLEMIRTLAK